MAILSANDLHSATILEEGVLFRVSPQLVRTTLINRGPLPWEFLFLPW